MRRPSDREHLEKLRSSLLANEYLHGAGYAAEQFRHRPLVVGDRFRHDRIEVARGLFDHRFKERLLVFVGLINRRLGDADGGGDVVHRRADITVLDK